jgi:hypothetical protein
MLEESGRSFGFPALSQKQGEVAGKLPTGFTSLAGATKKSRLANREPAMSLAKTEL